MAYPAHADWPQVSLEHEHAGWWWFAASAVMLLDPGCRAGCRTVAEHLFTHALRRL